MQEAYNSHADILLQDTFFSPGFHDVSLQLRLATRCVLDEIRSFDMTSRTNQRSVHAASDNDPEQAASAAAVEEDAMSHRQASDMLRN